MSDPLAYFLTWTCYGTWLHGDPRGSVDEHNNIFGQPFIATNEARQRHETGELRPAPISLNADQRQTVQQTIEDHCQHRGWELVALNVRTNHVHVVVACGETTPERAMSEFKSWCTRRLRESQLLPPTKKLWTRHGSRKYLWNHESVETAVRYALEGQGPDLDGPPSEP